jgi:tRNA(Ile)-lysidine synthetase-like protein
MTTRIRDFWLSHPECWIAISKKQQEADQLIYDTFQDYNPATEDDFGKIIYFDQFVRHFSRIDTISEQTVAECRRFAVQLVEKQILLEIPESELIWYLMPWKHTEQWKPIFQTISDWLVGRRIVEFPQLNRFFQDTYAKAYSEIRVELSEPSEPSEPSKPSYDAADICESYPEAYESASWSSLPLPSAPALQTEHRVAISLSGGVDSMLMCALLKRTGHDVVAIHIVYGNRAESAQERKFIEVYCRKLSIPLYIYTVEWLRRDEQDREFYETMTRTLRFRAYKTLQRPVVLGHIREDVVENIWTNFARGTHLDNLAKFRSEVIEDGVRILRPWLHIHKSEIYAAAKQLAIPYLKNTTPLWSNRGKFRNEFLQAVIQQYGPGVDKTVVDVAQRIGKQTELLDRLLYIPISESWDAEKKRINITKAVEASLDADGWLRILSNVAHTRLRIPKPSWRACEHLVERFRRGTTHRVSLGKNCTVTVVKEGTTVFLSFLDSSDSYSALKN